MLGLAGLLGLQEGLIVTSFADLIQSLDRLQLRLGLQVLAVLGPVLGRVGKQLVLDDPARLDVEVMMVDVHVGEDHKVLLMCPRHCRSVAFMGGHASEARVKRQLVLSGLFVPKIREEIRLAFLLLVEVGLGLRVLSPLVAFECFVRLETAFNPGPGL